MPTLYDVAHLCSWNGYTQDMRSYLGVDKDAWENKEFWFPYGANLVYGPMRKTRIQRISEEMFHGYDGKDYYTHCMMRSYNPEVRIRQLIADRANPDIQDVNGWNALLVCCRNGWPGHLSIIKVLLDAGANINVQANGGWSPIWLSSSNGHISIVRELIRRGANLNIPNNTGHMPIDAAVYDGHIDVVKELVAAGATISNDTVSLSIIGGKVNILKYLLELGHTPPTDSVYDAVHHKKAGVIRILAKAGVDMNINFPVHKAISSNADDCLIELCKNGANLNSLDEANDTPLRHAILLGNSNAINILAQYKANINHITDTLTPLHYAIMMYSLFPVKERRACLIAMINAGPKFKTLDGEGETASDYARNRGLNDIVILIERAALKQRIQTKKKKIMKI